MTVSSSKVVKSLLWKVLEKGSVQIVSFVVTLVLARLLSASEYGVLSLVTVFTSIALVFVQGGLNTALVQKSEPTSKDYSTIFYVSLLVAIVLYCLLFILAPYIADFFGELEICMIARVIGLILIFGAFNSVQVAYANKHFLFPSVFKANLLASCVSGVVGIGMALNGFGVWALVGQQLSNQAVTCLTMLVVVEWRPTAEFSLASLKELFGFGSKVLAGNLLVSIFLNIRSVIIGKFYDSAAVGYFNRGRQFSTTVMEAINGSIQEVMLPTFSEVQSDVASVKNMLRKSIRSSTFLVFPLMLGLAAAASPLVDVLLTEKWAECVPYLQIFAVSYLFNPTQVLSAQALRGIGDSDTTLKIEVIRKTAEFLLLVICIPLGPVALALSSVLSGIIGCIVCFVPNVRRLGYSVKEQLSDVAFPIATSLIVFVCMSLVGSFGLGSLLTLIIECIVGVTVYFVIAWAVHNQTFYEYLHLLKSLSK